MSGCAARIRAATPAAWGDAIVADLSRDRCVRREVRADFINRRMIEVVGFVPRSRNENNTVLVCELRSPGNRLHDCLLLGVIFAVEQEGIREETHVDDV